MITQLYNVIMQKFEQNELEDICDLLDSGGIVAVPTETVYGLAVSLGNMSAIEELLKLKMRSVGGDKVLSLMLPVIDDMRKYVLLDHEVSVLLERYFPGELTAILPKNPEFRHAYFDAYKKIGVRIPNHSFMLNLLNWTGPLLVTSANLKGEEPCVDADAVLEKLGGRIDAVVLGRAGEAPASTVADFSEGEIRILRQGNLRIK